MCSMEERVFILMKMGVGMGLVIPEYEMACL